MIRIDRKSPERTIVPFVLEWFTMLSTGDVGGACLALDEPNKYGQIWTPESLYELIMGVFTEDTIFYRQFGAPYFSDPNDLPPAKFEPAGEFDDGSGYWFDHPVPLNGHWSDLSAQFEFYERANGFAVVLHDLHVL